LLYSYFLIELLFFSELLPALYSNFKDEESSSSAFGLLSSSQLTLLKLLDAIIDTIHSATEDRDPSGRPKVGSNYQGKLPFYSCAFFVSELSRLWTLKRKLQRTTSSSSSSSSSSSLSARASMELDESIFLLLQMLGAITAFEESGLRDVLQSHGIISTSIGIKTSLRFISLSICLQLCFLSQISLSPSPFFFASSSLSS
jgi:hypothetical protein